MGQGKEGGRHVRGGGELLAMNLFISPDVPSAPLLLTLEDVSNSSVTVSWEPPERLGRLGLQGYVLELCREGGEFWAKSCIHPGEVVMESCRDKCVGHVVGQSGRDTEGGDASGGLLNPPILSCSTSRRVRKGRWVG